MEAGVFVFMEHSFSKELETEVYITSENKVMIRQSDESGLERDDYIEISSKARCLEIANALIDLAEKCPFGTGRQP